MAWLDDPIFAENKNRQDKNFILPSCVLWGPGWAFPRSEFQNPLFDILRRKKCPHWHFTIFFFALVFIALQFQPIFVLFVAISLFYYVTISRPCHMSEFCLNRVIICIVHLNCYLQWQIQGRDQGGSPHNLISKIISIFFLDTGSPLISGSGWPPPHHLSEGLDRLPRIVSSVLRVDSYRTSLHVFLHKVSP